MGERRLLDFIETCIENATSVRRFHVKSWQAIPENRGTLKVTLHSQCTHQ